MFMQQVERNDGSSIEGLEEGTASRKKAPNCIAVTQLTSTTEDKCKKSKRFHNTLKNRFCIMQQLAKKAGLDGVVCSAHEVKRLREVCGEEFLTVTPGIRIARMMQS